MAAEPPQPPSGNYPQQPEGPPGYPQQQYYGQQPYYAPESNGVAVAGGVVGIVSLVLAFIPFIDFIAIPGGIAAIILGAIGLQRANRMGGMNRGMAITGIVTGSITIALTIIFVALVYSYFATHATYNFTYPSPT
jgi:hypothetical protein